MPPLTCFLPVSDKKKRKKDKEQKIEKKGKKKAKKMTADEEVVAEPSNPSMFKKLMVVSKFDVNKHLFYSCLCSQILLIQH